MSAGWFTNALGTLFKLEKSARRDALASRAYDFGLRYFEGANEQTGYLGAGPKGLFSQEHYLVCSLERIAVVGDVIGHLLLNRSLSVGVTHQTRWERAANWGRWRATVQWSGLARYYDQDEALYQRVSRAGCLAHTSSAWLRRALEGVAAPIVWVR